MPEHVHYASARRDDGLARIRKLSLWITGGAAAASLGLGAAFAHELPGHARAAASSTRSGAVTAGGSQRTGRGAQSGSGRSGAANPGRRHHQHALAKPAQAPQQPASNPAPPPVVSSGGS